MRYGEALNSEKYAGDQLRNDAFGGAVRVVAQSQATVEVELAKEGASVAG